ncbi:MAG: hypothetical protein KKC68_08760, partial [Candidatus Thermoplasmatota archaeon]|nr:hypothetical protein [Candidatus Thermoplasmatota archaeon]
SVDILRDNALGVYAVDPLIDYAEIIDIDEGDGNYYSTVQYRVIENGSIHQYTYPKEIYYWYIVAPEIASEAAMEVYGSLWRDYLLNHNDITYPLLKEKIQDIKYLWDVESYYQPNQRLWNWSMGQHPTAIEAISYWIGKTVPYGAIGSRPGQPQKIAHEHNGWCGELQRIAVAAQRTLLIPSVGACNVAEDHVWREFYERGWHENDNWWYDSGGAVDVPDVYAYGWGKNMSSIYAWQGDDAIYEVTSRYIHPEDRVTITFNVVDIFLQPMDGARVIALVEGIKDITWYTLVIWEKIQQIWDALPTILKGQLLQRLFNHIETRFEEIPDTIDGVSISVWNYTDASGTCQLTLGKNLEYSFLIQAEQLKKPWLLARHNTIRLMPGAENRTYTILFPDVRNRPQQCTTLSFPYGESEFSINFQTQGLQYHAHPLLDDIGRYPSNGTLEFFMVDATNFQRFENRQLFQCKERVEASSYTGAITVPETLWYFVFYNPTRHTFMNLNLTLSYSNPSTDAFIDIVGPYSSVLKHPTVSVGTSMEIYGVASDDIILTIGSENYPVPIFDGIWRFVWNTTEVSMGNYSVIATCDEKSDELIISIVDFIPPTIVVKSPSEGYICADPVLFIEGEVNDNVLVESLTLFLDQGDPQPVIINGTHWTYNLDLSLVSVGDHQFTLNARDLQGLMSSCTQIFVKNETGQSWGPQINWVDHQPAVNISATSNVIVYTNITATSPFRIDHVFIHVDNGSESWIASMFRYGDYPEQSRHPEDPRQNESNEP